MDYGKLAYIKAEELEARLAARETLPAEYSCTFTVTPTFDFGGGEYRACSVRAEGSALVFAVAVVRAKSDISGKLVLSLGGLKAGESALAAKAGEAKDVIVMCSAYIGGERDLTVSVTTPSCVLLSLNVLVYGADAEIVRTGGDAAADGYGDDWALIRSENDRVLVRLFTGPDFEGGRDVFLGSGRKADICRAGERYLAVYADVVGNVFTAFVGKDGSAGNMRFLTGGAEAVAAGSYGEGAIVALVSGGKLLVSVLDGEGGASEPAFVETDGTVTAVTFVKNARTPGLIVTTPARSYLMYCAEEHGGSDTATLSATLSFEKITATEGA